MERPSRRIRGAVGLLLASCVVASCAADRARDPAVLSEDGTAVVAESTVVSDPCEGVGLPVISYGDSCDPCDRVELPAETERFVTAWVAGSCQNSPVVAVSGDDDRVIVEVSVGPDALVDGDCDAALVEFGDVARERVPRSCLRPAGRCRAAG